MAREEHRTPPRPQARFEELGCPVVEVIRRLVEQQRLGSAEQQGREGEPAALTARELVDAAIEAEVPDAEAVEQLVAAGLGRPDVRTLGGVERGRVPVCARRSSSAAGGDAYRDLVRGLDTALRAYSTGGVLRASRPAESSANADAAASSSRSIARTSASADSSTSPTRSAGSNGSSWASSPVRTGRVM